MQLLMVRRAERSEFMGGAYVFPGGSVDEIDDSVLARRAVRWAGDPAEAPWRAAALRELVEEAGVVLGEGTVPIGVNGEAVYRSVLDSGFCLDADRLAYLSNWVTPAGLPKRFDTRFFVASVPPGTKAQADATEVFDSVWVTPAQALERAAEWNVPFPTRRHLELLDGFEAPEAVMAFARGLEEVPRVEPRVAVSDNGLVRVLLPGDPDYEEAVR